MGFGQANCSSTARQNLAVLKTDAKSPVAWKNRAGALHFAAHLARAQLTSAVDLLLTMDHHKVPVSAAEALSRQNAS